MLALDPNDLDAKHTKLSLLLRTSQYDEALKLTDDSTKEWEFERAYALYRLQKESEARSLLEQSLNEDRGVQLLRAQIVCPSASFSSSIERPNLGIELSSDKVRGRTGGLSGPARGCTDTRRVSRHSDKPLCLLHPFNFSANRILKRHS